MESGIFALLGAIVGAAIGFAGGWLMERHRWEQARRLAVMAVLLEVSFLGETLESAAKEGARTRESLQSEWWNRHGPDLVNYLPGHLVKALHLLYYDLDRQRHWYSDFTRQGDAKDSSEEQWKQVQATFLGWAYQAQYVADQVKEYNIRRRRLRMPLIGRQSPKEEGRKSMQFIKDMHRQAIERLRAEGFTVDGIGEVVD